MNLFKKQYLVSFLKAIGEEFQKQPEKFLEGDVQNLTDFSIWISFYEDRLPEINISKSVQSKESIKAFLQVEANDE